MNIIWKIYRYVLNLNLIYNIKNMKTIKTILVAIVAMLMVSSCGISNHLTTNANLNETSVVLSQNNFKVVKTVSSQVTSTYVLGIGGISKKALTANAVADLTKKAGLTGSQALINVTVKENATTILGVYSKITFIAEGTVVEFVK